ncbi:MAG TPA: ribbon-helix-helix domain-containing protein [Caulobacteraceae bacterium]|jgi:predicted DNA-binding ribbon-helix-helix protein|nr:ribbon-helix-helix domain-containing protein [Caulobacteraceae bacterium]
MVNLRKRSLTLTGHSTSLALEPEFWSVLEAKAQAENRSLAALVGDLDKSRGPRPLASACRLAALAWAQRRSALGPPSRS